MHHSLPYREKERTSEQSADQAKDPSTGSAAEKVHHSLAHKEKERTCEQSADQAKNPSTGSAGRKRCTTHCHIGRRRGPVSKEQTKLNTPVQVQRRCHRRGPVSKAQTKLKTPVQVQRREKVPHSLAHRERKGTCRQSAHQAKNPSTD